MIAFVVCRQKLVVCDSHDQSVSGPGNVFLRTRANTSECPPRQQINCGYIDHAFSTRLFGRGRSNLFFICVATRCSPITPSRDSFGKGYIYKSPSQEVMLPSTLSINGDIRARGLPATQSVSYPRTRRYRRNTGRRGVFSLEN